MGVALTDALTNCGFVAVSPECCDVTPTGMDWLKTWGIDVKALHRSRRMFARPCLDWSERRFHIGGALGAAITTTMFDRGWLERMPNTRGVLLTKIGQCALAKEFGLSGL